MKRVLLFIFGFVTLFFADLAQSQSPPFSGDLNHNVVSASEFGAKCDGVTNDSLAIQTAYDAATARGGQEVYIPPGICAISTTIVMRGSGIVVRGAGLGYQNIFPTSSGGTKLLWTGNTSSSMIIFGANSAGQDTFGGGVRDLTFDGNVRAVYGLTVKDNVNGSFENLGFQGQTHASLVLTNSTDRGKQFPTANLNFKNISISLRGGATNSANGIWCNGVGSGAEGVTLSTWNNIQIQHANGDGILVG